MQIESDHLAGIFVDVIPSILPPGSIFAAEDPLPRVYQDPLSPRRPIAMDIVDSNSSTCLKIPATGQPPEELSLRLDAYGPHESFSLGGKGIQCDESHVVAMTPLTDSCSGGYITCTLRAEGAEGCHVTCSLRPPVDPFTVLVYLRAFADIDALLCDVQF
ncbi:hypothetical protein CAPTEDRAFT_214739 [Capitella teleta]|uniref:Uncharacterized protein n=1 Tax=Capitella teleta TaxID=283909 RepID=R7V5V3_CAPTE|nr:hypothetical protein CAPTEDRAFT_214739 [Capitella teleta]|eukprot:ELU11701.1 hypothetical protein CAPTEDRAFT_214739 [Capitella teleta]